MGRLGRLLALAAPAAHRSLRYPLLAAAASSLLYGAYDSVAAADATPSSQPEGQAPEARQEPPTGPKRFKEGQQFKVPLGQRAAVSHHHHHHQPRNAQG
jgi:hypothetical protein